VAVIPYQNLLTTAEITNQQIGREPFTLIDSFSKNLLCGYMKGMTIYFIFLKF
jgi:hypothetical protein